MRSDKSLFWDYLFVCLTMFMTGLSFYSLAPIIPLFSKNNLFASETQIGIIMSTFAIGSLVSRPIAGIILDLSNRKLIGFIGLVGYLITIILYAFILNWELLTLIRIVHGFFWGIVSTSLYTIVSDIIPTKKRGVGFGIFGSLVIVCTSIAPYIAYSIYNYKNFEYLVYIASIFAAFAIIFYSLVTKNSQAHFESADKGLKFSMINLFSPYVLSILCIYFIVSLTFSSILSFILLYANHYKIDQTDLFFTLYGLSTLIIRPLHGKVFDNKWNMLLSLKIGTLTGMVGFFLLGFFAQNAIYLISACLLGTSFGILFILPQIMAINISTPENRGKINASISIVQDIGFIIGPIFFGKICQISNYHFIYIQSGIIYLVLFGFITIWVKPLIRMAEQRSYQ